MDTTPSESHSSTLEETVRRFFVPTLADFILYMVIALTALLIANRRAIWDLLHAGTLQPQDAIHLVFSERLQLVGQILNAPIFGRLSLLLFWAFVGCMTYMILWLIQYMLSSAREDFVEGQYVHPKSYDNKSYWRSIIAHNIFLFSAIVVFLGFIVLSLRMFLPILSKLFYVGLYTAPALIGFVDLLVSILLIGFILYLIKMLWRVLKSAWQMNSLPVTD